jgi:hypothetical protein
LLNSLTFNLKSNLEGIFSFFFQILFINIGESNSGSIILMLDLFWIEGLVLLLGVEGALCRCDDFKSVNTSMFGEFVIGVYDG